MATKKITDAPTKISFTYEDKDYTLEFNRATVRNMEGRGFIVEDAVKAPMTYLPMLFHGAFLMHHPQVTPKVAEKIYEAMPNKDELFTALMTAYSEPMQYLFEEPEESKKVAWTVIK